MSELEKAVQTIETLTEINLKQEEQLKTAVELLKELEIGCDWNCSVCHQGNNGEVPEHYPDCKLAKFIEGYNALHN